MRHLNGMGAVFRAIPSKALTLDELKMPEAVRQMCRANNGLILVTGKTGSGKSTTLAAMIDDINTRVQGHILTIEDPIEFVHERKSCLISQREIGVHSPSFAAALHSALREDPDVILVGELRDLETMSIAVTAAEMGILVMGTLHTNGAAQTVDRMVNVFPSDKQSHVRTMLSTSLRGVVSQQLLQRADKQGRVAALEILVNTPAASNLIRQGKLDQLENTMQSGGAVRHAHHGHRHPAAAGPALRSAARRPSRRASTRQVRGGQGHRLRPRGRRRSAAAKLCKLARMSRKIFVTTALPYANGPLHIGHIMEYIQADIWVRFQRMQGHEVHFVVRGRCARRAHHAQGRGRGGHAAGAGGAHRRRPPPVPRGLSPQLRSLALHRLAGEHRAVAGHLRAG